jgi:uncharacterized membrane protein YeaQ/YmgE (transglycosylase-associated protein family)
MTSEPDGGVQVAWAMQQRRLLQRRKLMFGVLGWILFGLVAGVIAKLLMPGRDPGGFIVTILLGIAGALVGGFLGRVLGLYGEGEGAGMLMSIIGAVILLVLYRVLMKPRAARP